MQKVLKGQSSGNNYEKKCFRSREALEKNNLLKKVIVTS
jgi:hypothetical protein